MTAAATAATNVLAQKQGKYLTFALAEEEYGLEILKVREINGYMDITPVPQTPVYVKGVINLRGQVIPVIDLRAKFGMESKEVTEQTCIIVVEVIRNGQKADTGIVVDRVQEVLYISGDQIQETPEFGAAVDTNFILGLGKVGKSVKILLDIDKVLAGAALDGIDGQCNCPQTATK
jgi:purine-binding chemotaxis protein CheW